MLAQKEKGSVLDLCGDGFSTPKTNSFGHNFRFLLLLFPPTHHETFNGKIN